MTKQNKLIEAALAGLTTVQKGGSAKGALPKFSGNSCNSKGGCGSKK